MEFVIFVHRSGAGQGSISFQGQMRTCWEDVSNLIPTKTYVNCTAAYMAVKKRIGIAIPNEQTGKNGIYIHEGCNSSWSDGCIVTDPAFVKIMYDALWASGKNHGATVILSGSEGILA